MNKLPLQKRVAIISALVEGCSLRSTSRMVGVSINTVTKLLVDVGRVFGLPRSDHAEPQLSAPANRRNLVLLLRQGKARPRTPARPVRLRRRLELRRHRRRY